MRSVETSTADIVKDLGGELVGAVRVTIERITSLENASFNCISFLSAPKYAHQFPTSRAGCVIAKRQDIEAALAAGFKGACIATDDPYLYFAKLTQWWKLKMLAAASENFIHPTAVIGERVQLGQDVRIGALCVIEDGAVIGSGTDIRSRVTIGADCVVGKDCLIHSGAVVGADGFGFAPNKATGEWVKIEQLGAVRIGNRVEIGANTCIDRGALEDTVIEDGVKLDNLIQIGHNVHIGKHTAMAGCVGVAGSAKIGAHCTVGGGAVVLGHLSLADHVHISAASVVTRSIHKAGNYTGVFPLDDNHQWEKNAATLKQLHTLRERIKRLENT